MKYPKLMIEAHTEFVDDRPRTAEVDNRGWGRRPGVLPSGRDGRDRRDRKGKGRVRSGEWGVGAAVLLLLLLLLGTAVARAATVVGTVVDVTGTPVTSTLRFAPLSNPQVVDATVITSSIKSVTATNGAFSVTLTAGDYQVTVGGRDTFSMAVPSSVETYNIQTLVTESLVYTYSGIPGAITISPATSLTIGGVKTDETSGNPVVYLKTTMDTLLQGKLNTNDTVLPANVKWYGAVGDGVANDTAAINAAIVAARNVYIPPGTYMVDEISVGNNTTLVGAGWSSILKKRTNSNSYAISSTSGTMSTNVRVAYLQIDGNKAAYTHSPVGGGGINLAGWNISVEGCYIHDTVDAGVHMSERIGTGWGTMGAFRVANNYFRNCSKAGTNYGAVAITGGNQVTVSGNQIECDDGGQAYGIDIEPNLMSGSSTNSATNISQIIISDNVVRGGNLQVDGENLVQPGTTNKVAMQNVIVTGNIIDARGKALTGFATDVASWWRNLSNVVCANNVFIGGDSPTIQYRCAAFGSVTNLIFTGNMCVARTNTAANNEICVFFDYSKPCTNVTVVGNHFTSEGGTSYYGVFGSTYGAGNFKGMGNHYIGFGTNSVPNDYEMDNAAALALLYATTNFAGLVRVGSQTAGTGLIVGSQTAAQTGFGNQVGIEAYTSSTTEGAPIIVLNTATNGTAYIESQYVLWNEVGTGVRAGKLKFRKETAWAAGDEDTYFTLDLAANGSTAEKFRVDSTGKAYIGQAGGGAIMYNSVLMGNGNNIVYSSVTPALGASGTNIVVDFASSSLYLSTTTNMNLASVGNAPASTNYAYLTLDIFANGANVTNNIGFAIKVPTNSVTFPLVITNGDIGRFSFCARGSVTLLAYTHFH